MHKHLDIGLEYAIATILELSESDNLYEIYGSVFYNSFPEEEIVHYFSEFEFLLPLYPFLSVYILPGFIFTYYC